MVLPEVEDYCPKGVSPLATAEEWVKVDCPSCGRPGRREVDTMDTFVDSSWYFIRYCDPGNTEAPWDRELADFWGPVDQYTGGVDHATMHMIYSRFFCKVLTDMGLLGFREPFCEFFGNGLGADGPGSRCPSRGQRRSGPSSWSRSSAPTRCGVHPLHRPGRPGHGVDGRRDRGRAEVRPAPVAGVHGGGERRPQARRPTRRWLERRTRRSHASRTTSGAATHSTRRSLR